MTYLAGVRVLNARDEELELALSVESRRHLDGCTAIPRQKSCRGGGGALLCEEYAR